MSSCAIYLYALLVIVCCASTHALPRDACPYRCRSGECINLDDLCDGAAHCLDASDETPELCGAVMCPGYTFRCDYGACVGGTTVCDGKLDCLDGSDEQKLLCTAIGMQGNCDNWEIRCSSGECIPYAKLCDNQVDCHEGDDEAISLCGDFIKHTTIKTNHIKYILKEQETNFESIKNKTLPTSTESYNKIPDIRPDGCYVPNLQNLIVKNGREEVLVAGEYVQSGGFIYYSCQVDNTLKGGEANICKGTRWLYGFSYCQKPERFAFIIIVVLFTVMSSVLLVMIYRMRYITQQLQQQSNTDQIWLVERESTGSHLPSAPSQNSITLNESTTTTRGITSGVVPETPPPAYHVLMQT